MPDALRNTDTGEIIHTLPPGHKCVGFVHGRKAALYAIVWIDEGEDGYYMNVLTKEARGMHYAGHA